MFDQTPTQQPYGAPMMGGYQYNGMGQPVVKVQNVLTADEIKELQQQRSQFTLGLTERETKQAACNHRTIDGTSDSLVFNQVTGTATCTICGYEFRPVDADTTIDSIKEDTDRIVDILQTIKLLYTDLPGSAAREYFQIIPLIAKIPELFKFAAKNFASHENNAWQYNNANMGGFAMLQNLNSMLGGNFGQPQMMGQPGVYAPQQPQMMGTPGFPQAAYAPQPGVNPFGYQGASQPGYQPMSQGYQYNPAQGTTPVAPTVAAPTAPAPEAAADTTVTQAVTV